MERYLRGRFSSDTVAFECFEASFAGWARRSEGGLDSCLRALAEESCGVIEASVASALKLKAPRVITTVHPSWTSGLCASMRAHWLYQSHYEVLPVFPTSVR